MVNFYSTTDFYSTIFCDANGQFVLSDGSYGNPGCDSCGTYSAYVKREDGYWCKNCLPVKTLMTERRNYYYFLNTKIELSFSVTLTNEEYIL